MKNHDSEADVDEIRGDFDPAELVGGVRGKHLDRYRSGTNLALLAPDVRAAFPTDEAVNQALRALIQNQQMNASSLV